jgi:hypothetical protein
MRTHAARLAGHAIVVRGHLGATAPGEFGRLRLQGGSDREIAGRRPYNEGDRSDFLGALLRSSIVASLKEFLESEAEKLRGEQSQAMMKRDEWIASVQGLLDRIKEWLRDADTRRILTLKEDRVRLREVGIGDYEAPALFVEIGARQVSIKPVARVVAGALASSNAVHIIKSYGRVDMASPLEKFLLFRTQKAPEDRWIIIEEDGYRSQPLDRNSFETAFQSLLS